MRKRRWYYAGAIVTVAAACALFRVDGELHRRCVDQRSERTVRLAAHFSYWGDLFPGTVAVCGVVFGIGLLRKRSRWRRTALACAAAALLAIVVVNAIKSLSGRPRPYVGREDGFYGPTPGQDYRSFPSGHAATSAATAAALSAAFPPLTPLAAAAAGGVAWSRVCLDMHYVSDILVGAMIGIGFGLPFGFAARKGKG